MKLLSNLYHRLEIEYKNLYNYLFSPTVTLPPCTILAFHGIDDIGNSSINSRFISATKFEDLIILLKSKGTFIRVQDCFDKNYDQGRPHFALTFDDGYRNNLTHLLPILEKLKIPASIYISTIRTIDRDILWPDALDMASYLCKDTFSLNKELFYHTGHKGYKSKEFSDYLKYRCVDKEWDYIEKMMQVLPGVQEIRSRKDLFIYWQLLNEKEIRLLAGSPWITIGSHGQKHINLGSCSFDLAIGELKNSKEYLEKCIEKKIVELSYPFGISNPAIMEAAYKVGYKNQLLTEMRSLDISKYPFCLPRLVVNSHISNKLQSYWIANNNYR